ncbi:endo alpha-1,4 polygalactosaminidase [Streptomyces sp. NPDC048639]|uniref:endo alpha-1,4 polygalactosaminidase n=1 Tax=Streptomyces sp. NPDC048639 TaxID=3365581 RepID=UPI0037202958
MSTDHQPGSSLRRWIPFISAATLAGAVALLSGHAQALPASPALPPANSGFDYQIGGAYTPPDGVQVVSRDHGDSPAPGLYNICYINAFQTQPGERDEWPSDLILKDSDGKDAEDPDWPGEYALDLATPEKRSAVAERIGGLIDTCASKGFDAPEPDNYDTFTRFDGLTAEHAKAYMSLLVDRAHARDLAIAQKNTVELAADARSLGIDFAVVEECGVTWPGSDGPECSAYEEAFGDLVLDVEYTEEGFEAACSGWSGRFGIVQRDVDVSTPGSGDYVRRTCED